jgi:predicted small lipoprotein YifL
MKLLSPLLLAGLFLVLTACGESGPSEADLAAEVEADRLEAINQELEVSVEAVETTSDELVDALDSLTVLFSEDQ